MDEELFLGYVVKKENNSIHLRFNDEQYKQIISDALSIGMKPQAYMSMLTKPCQICGNDKVHIELIKKDMRRTSNVHSVHLIVFQESQINTQTELTTLKLKYVLSGMLQVDNASPIYTPKGTHKFTEGKTNATLTVFKNNVRTTTINCIIKNNEIHPHESL